MEKIVKYAALIASGALIGFINGFFGGGGGLIAVPVLEKIAGIKTKSAHATAILIILPISIISAAVYIIQGKFVWETGLWAGAGVILGGILGAVLLSKLSNNIIKIIFALMMLAAGIKMVLG